MRSIIFIFTTLFLLTGLAARGQDDPKKRLAAYQDSLKKIEPLIFKSKTDEEKYAANQRFLALLEEALAVKNSFDFPFDSLKGIARLTSDDKKFRILNWNLPKEDGTHEYFGFIQVHVSKEKTYKTFPLIDKSDDIRSPETAVTNNEKWYGMLYYEIITKKHKKQTYYTLLGWDGNDMISKKRIIEGISFAADGTPRFGDSSFDLGKKKPRRIIFEHAKDVSMTLKYDESQKMIVFAHLVPRHPALEGQGQFYIHDGSYDGLEFKKGKWEFVKDVDARNEKSKNDALEGKALKNKPVYIPKTGKRKKKEE
jgi:hypothetical protein